MNVKFLDFRKLYTHYSGLDDVIKRCLITGKLILQEDVELFEKRLAEYLGVKYAVGLNSGTDALMLALIAAGVKEGDEVITVSHTFIATIQVIHHLGAKPVLVDVDEETGLMDMNKIRRAINAATKAVIPVHLMGDVCDMETLAAVIKSERHDGSIKIIEDAAQAIGAKGLGGRGYGIGQCYSFYPAKILGTFGDAGALTTNDKDVADRVRSLRNHGGVTKYAQDTYEYGWNSRLDNVWAAVLNEKLDYLGVDIERRKQIANQYLNAFVGLPMKLPSKSRGRVWQDFVVRVEDPQKFCSFLREQGVETLGCGQLPNHYHKGLGLDGYSLPNTVEWVEKSVRLPCNQFMEQDEVDYVIDKVIEFYDSESKAGM